MRLQELFTHPFHSRHPYLSRGNFPSTPFIPELYLFEIQEWGGGILQWHGQWQGVWFGRVNAPHFKKFHKKCNCRSGYTPSLNTFYFYLLAIFCLPLTKSAVIKQISNAKRIACFHCISFIIFQECQFTTSRKNQFLQYHDWNFSEIQCKRGNSRCFTGP